MPLFLFLSLLQAIWAGSYIAMKLALGEIPVGLVMILRYGLATLFFAAAGQFSLREKFTAREWGLILFVGIANFSGSPFFQLKALTLTQAIDVSIMVSFEPLIAALLAFLFLRERMEKSAWIVFCVATLGVILMSSGKTAAGFSIQNRLIGDILFFCSLIAEGIYQVSSRHLTQRHPPFKLAAWMMFAGFGANLLANASTLTAENFSRLSGVGIGALIYLSLFCSTVAYSAWVWMLKRTPVGILSLSIFLQPIFGTFFAALILKETVDINTILGASLVLFTLLAWKLHTQIFGTFKSKTGIAT